MVLSTFGLLRTIGPLSTTEPSIVFHCFMQYITRFPDLRIYPEASYFWAPGPGAEKGPHSSEKWRGERTLWGGLEAAPVAAAVEPPSANFKVGWGFPIAIPASSSVSWKPQCPSQLLCHIWGYHTAGSPLLLPCGSSTIS